MYAQLVLCFVSIQVLSALAGIKYIIPEPTIKVFKNGFNVSIPDHRGITQFAFIGSVNKELAELSQGQYVQEVNSKKGGLWVYENRNCSLKIGDVINYWLFVSIDGLGYRREFKPFPVTEILDEEGPYPPSKGGNEGNITQESGENTSEEGGKYPSHNFPSPPPCQGNNKQESGENTWQEGQLHPNVICSQPPTPCQSEIFGAQLIELHNDLRQLRKENSLLRDLVESNSELATTLEFRGAYVENNREKNITTTILHQKLQLHVPIQYSTPTKNGILVRVFSLNDKLKILARYMELQFNATALYINSFPVLQAH